MFYAYRGSTTLLILNASPILTTLKAEYNYKLTMQQMVSPDPSSWTIRQVLDEDGEEEGGDVAMLHFEDEDDVERFLKSKKVSKSHKQPVTPSAALLTRCCHSSVLIAQRRARRSPRRRPNSTGRG